MTKTDESTGRRSVRGPAGSSRPRIFLSITSLSAGGAERVIISLANHLVGRGHAVTLASFERPGTLPYYPLDPRVDLRQLGIPVGPWPVLRAVQRVVALRRLLRQYRPDVIISFLVRINILIMLAAAGLGIPVIVSERNNPERQRVSPVWNWLRLALYPLADCVVAPSRGVLEAFPPAVRRRGRVIPNPVELTGRARLSGERRTIVGVGRLVPQKGFDLLLPAYASIAPQRSDWNLIIYGEGPERSRLEALAADLGLEGRVAFPGLTRQPGEWVHAAGVFVLSSRFESFGNVITEAMSWGVPVIAFDCPWGPADIIRDGVDGLLVPAENVPALASALLRITGDPAMRAELGEAARSGVLRFAVDEVMVRWNEVISGVR